MTRNERALERVAWLAVAPTLLLVLLVGLYPLASTIRASFTDAWTDTPDEASWVGLGNYRKLAADEEFRGAVKTTVKFTVVSVALELTFGLALALLLNRNFRGRGLMRGAMLVPWVLPTVVSSQLFAWMFNDVYGVFNDLLVNQLHVMTAPRAWLAEPGVAFWCVVTVDVWKTTPFMALLLLAGLQTISSDVVEAAKVDGAGRWRTLLSVTLPLLRPTIAVALIFRTLDALRVFDVVWVMTKGGVGTETMTTSTYRQLMDFQQLGYGSAQSVVIFLLIAIFTTVYLLTVRVEEA